MDRDDGGNPRNIQDMVYIRLWIQQHHLPAAVEDGFGRQREKPNTDRGKKLYIREIHNDPGLFPSTVVCESGFDLACADNVKLAF
jgi:hypothetical protein